MQKMCLSLDVKSLKERQFEGLGAVFGNRDLGGDIIMPGAFTKTLRDPPNAIRPLLWMHKPDQVAGRIDHLSEDDTGLVTKATLAPTDLGNELHTLLKMGAVGAMSIGYETVDYSFDRKGNRILKELILHEISLVSMPMNPLAQVQYVKSRMSAAGEYVPTTREFESALRDVGCSKSVARRLVALCRDLEDDGETPPPDLVEPEEISAAKALQAIAEKIQADAIRRKFAA